MKSFWTTRYTLINVTYFVAFCTIHAMAAVYLLDKGFNNTEIGILLALANILSAVFQPLIASVIDRQGYLTNRRFILIAVTVIMVGSLVLMLSGNNKPLSFAVYVLIYMIQFAYMPVMTALCFEYQKAGCNIYYGLARGLGSASFAVTSFFVGRAIEKSGVNILLIINVITMILSAIIVFTFKKPDECAKKAVSESSGDEMSETAGDLEIKTGQEKVVGTGKTQRGIKDFAKSYPMFVLFLVGTVCFYFAHNMINDFMIQIIKSLGGGETELGYSNFLQAILELPVMAVIGFFLKKISSGKMLIFSGFAFFVKILILVFATNMAMMYLSQSFQLFAYAVFIPAAAYYVSSHMSENDQVKGQAFVTSAITLGGVFSNLISGVILDNAGIREMLITGSAVCLVGVIIAFIALSRSEKADKAVQTAE